MRGTRPCGGRGPGGPGKECGQLAQLLGVSNQPLGQATVVGRRHEILCPIGDLILESVGIDRTQAQGARRGVVVVLLHGAGYLAVDLALLVGGELGIGPLEPLPRHLIGNVERPVVKILRREVRAEISAVAPDRAVGHEAVLEEDLLARNHVVAGKDDGAAGSHRLCRYRRRLAIGLDGQSDQDGEAEDHRDDCSDLPPDR